MALRNPDRNLGGRKSEGQQAWGVGLPHAVLCAHHARNKLEQEIKKKKQMEAMLENIMQSNIQSQQVQGLDALTAAAQSSVPSADATPGMTFTAARTHKVACAKFSRTLGLSFGSPLRLPWSGEHAS